MSSHAEVGQDGARKKKVFGIGLSRTGTTSLTHALTVLGYRTIHYPVDSTSIREITEYLERDADAVELSVLRDNDALTDLPVCCIYKGLDRAYPDSRFILTVREKNAWLDSVERFWEQFLVPLTTDNLDTVEAQFGTFLERKLGERLIGRSIALQPGADQSVAPYYDRDVFSEFYDVYHNDVREYFKDKPGQLLTIEIVKGEGWEKLAPFLNEPVPDEPFPSEMRLRKRKVGAGADDSSGMSAVEDAESCRNDVEVVQAYIDAFRNHDLSSCEQYFADDALLKFMERRVQGQRAISDWHRDRFKQGASILNVGEIEAADDVVIVDLTVTSRRLKRWRVKLGGQAVIRLADDKIAEMGFEGIRLVR